MNLALIVPGGVDRSGSQRVIPALLNLIERLAERHSVQVIALNQEREFCNYPLLGASVTNLGASRLPLAGANFAHRLRTLRHVLRRHGPFDVLHAFWAIGPGTLAVLAGKYCRTPVVVSIGGGEFARLPDVSYGGGLTWRGRRQAGYAVQHAALVTAGSHYALRQCARRDARWLPLGVDVSSFVSTAARCQGPPWRLLQVASLSPVKDQFTALGAMRLLLDRGCDVEMEFIGEDTTGGRVRQFADSLGLNGRARFTGFLPNRELVARYSRAHLYVQSSLHESQGVALLEAAAAGLPLAGSDVGLLHELAPHAAAAVPPRDPIRLAAAIEPLLHDRPRCESLARHALRFACEHDADWTADRFESLYESLCHPARKFRSRGA